MTDKERYERIAEDFLKKMTSQQERCFAEIVDNHNSSDSLKLLAKEFNLTKNAVKIVYKHLLADGRIRDKLHNKWSDREIDTIRQMINAGHSISEVSITLEKHESSIRRKVRDLFGCIPVIDIPGEEWRRVDNTNYEVSNNGRFRRIGQRRIAVGAIRNGYITQCLIINGVEHRIKIHRLVAKAFIPNPDNKEQVDHIDGNPANNHVSNLRWVTAEENSNNIHRLKLLSEQAEKRKTDKLINDSLKAIFDTGLTKLDLIQKILDYKEVSPKD